MVILYIDPTTLTRLAHKISCSENCYIDDQPRSGQPVPESDENHRMKAVADPTLEGPETRVSVGRHF